MNARRPAAPKRLTPAMLERIALFHLSRFESSAANLRRLLARRIARSASFHGDDPTPLLAEADRLVAVFETKGALDDSRYAALQAARLRRRGISAKAIGQRLASKGVAQETAQAAIADDPDSEYEAAERFARRRRLGRFRTGGGPEHRLRDLAALGRAGFAYDIARRIVGEAAESADWAEADAFPDAPGETDFTDEDGMTGEPGPHRTGLRRRKRS